MPQITVLFVDDEIVVGSDAPNGSYMCMYTEACRDVGFKIVEADGIENGLEIVKHNSEIDVAVIDALMPVDLSKKDGARDDFDGGYSLAKKIVAHRPMLPIIFLTNANAVAPTKKLRNLGSVKKILFKDSTPPSYLIGEIRNTLSLEEGDTTLDPPEWRSLIRGEKLAVFEKFLHGSKDLTQAEFLLLSDLNHGLIQRLAAIPKPEPSKVSPWGRYTNEQLLSAVPMQEESKEKGEILEELVLRLFNSIEGFEAKTRLLTETEEIDIFILNGSTHAPWRDMGPALIGECKNWSVKCGVSEYTHFESKVRSRYGQCKCGFFVSWNGFASTFDTQKTRASREDILIVSIEGEDLEESVLNDSFESVLRRLWEDAVST